MAFGSLVHAQTPQAGRTKTEIRSLIRQLDDDSYKTREAAHAKLLKIGPPAGRYLRAALDGGRLEPEGKMRAEYILNFIYVPESGVVWRGRYGAEAPKGMQDGDVVIEAGGRPIVSWGDWCRSAEDDAEVVLTCWRKKVGRFEATVEMNPRIRGGASLWPDWYERYNQFGHKGKWDATVMEAIRLSQSGSLKAEGVFRNAWKAGCRDAMICHGIMAAFWARSDLDGLAAAFKQMAGEVKRTHPGGLYRYGTIPYRAALLQRARGEKELSTRMVAKAYDQAVKADAWQAADYLRGVQFLITLADSPEKAPAFWKRHATEIRRMARYLSPNPVDSMVVHLSAGGQPELAVRFLAGEPKALGRDWLLQHFKSQASLCAKARSPGRGDAEFALVYWEPYIGPHDGVYPDRKYVMADELRSAVDLPVRVDCEVRLIKQHFRPIAMSTTISSAIGTHSRLMVVRLRGNGTVCVVESQLMKTNPIPTLTIGPTNVWQSLRIEQQLDYQRAYVDDKLYTTVYHPSVEGKTMRVNLGVRLGVAEYRNIRLYVGSPKKTDNAAIEKLLKQFYQARIAGDLAALRVSSKGLNEHLGDIAGAKPFLEEIAYASRACEKMSSKEGLGICDPEHLKFCFDNHLGWKAKDGVLSATRCPCDWSYLGLRLTTGDMEVTGVFDGSAIGNKSLMYIYWNNSGYTYTGPAYKNNITYKPGKSIALGGYVKHGVVTPVKDKRRMLPFCLRVRKDTAVLFVGDATKPAARLSGINRTGTVFWLGAGHIAEGGVPRFHDVRIRYLGKGEKLDAPAKLPKLPKG